MDEERDRTDQPLPGSVSNQNGEEAEPGHDDAGGETRRRPPRDDEKPSGGEAGEGSQSTGDPRSAG